MRVARQYKFGEINVPCLPRVSLPFTFCILYNLTPSYHSSIGREKGFVDVRQPIGNPGTVTRRGGPVPRSVMSSHNAHMSCVPFLNYRGNRNESLVSCACSKRFVNGLLLSHSAYAATWPVPHSTGSGSNLYRTLRGKYDSIKASTTEKVGQLARELDD